ncbi:NAD(P)-dependent oxidoreductase [uncultured Maricaulis sp.]|uniref:NAD(P)-dependent oxidoreductase n=1 Tax=uncultured Maricaulis sp. TaxID=174710 RepID=UPI00262D1A31|nr:NAD(P)-dependent oxidoreductase [uncultured Maricaulis sp.]
MLRFVDIDQAYPDKRSERERRQDFNEIYRGFSTEAAADQASRCSQCGVPFCQSGCPLQNNIPDWLMLAGEDRLREAYDASAATSTMPEICGRICPQDRLCEGSCVVEKSKHGAVTIGAVEQYITDTAWNEGWVEPLEPGPERGQSVGIIGSGPAGLAAAERLRESGFAITVYERADRAGGLLMYGIPGFKLEKHVVQRRLDRLAKGGVEFKLGFEIGRDASLDAIREQHHAVLLATGVYQARQLTCPGSGDGVLAALDYLTRSNRDDLGDPAANDSELDAKGKDVVVVGGGDTAMDCVRTAVRQGAKSVTCLYRRDRANMPGSAREVKHAEEEGVVFEWLSAPLAVLTKGDAISAVRVQGMRLGSPDASGRRAPEPDPGQTWDRPADMVISALGFTPEDLPVLFEAPDLSVHRDGRVEADRDTRMASLDGVFVAGDLHRGASLVVWAIKDGLDAARSIESYLDNRMRVLGAAE